MSQYFALMAAKMYVIRCRRCKVEILFCDEESIGVCICCGIRARKDKMWTRGPRSLDGVARKEEKIARKEKKIKNLTVVADCCEFCGCIVTEYVAVRIAKVHHAACPRCYERIETVRLPRRA